MSAQHTPGPWHVVRYGDGDSLVICSDEAGDHRIAFMAVPGARDSSARKRAWAAIKANAHAISATPDLLRFAQQMFNGIDTGMIRLDTPADETLANTLRKGRAAIAKAAGLA